LQDVDTRAADLLLHGKTVFVPVLEAKKEARWSARCPKINSKEAQESVLVPND
jgi:hypothetical protein